MYIAHRNNPRMLYKHRPNRFIYLFIYLFPFYFHRIKPFQLVTDLQHNKNNTNFDIEVYI